MAPPTLARVETPARADSHATEPKGILGTVRNATLLLELLARGPAFQSVTALAEQSGLSIATAHRVLRSLAQAGLVRQSKRSLGYGLGPGLVRLSEPQNTPPGRSTRRASASRASCSGTVGTW